MQVTRPEVNLHINDCNILVDGERLVYSPPKSYLYITNKPIEYICIENGLPPSPALSARNELSPICIARGPHLLAQCLANTGDRKASDALNFRRYVSIPGYDWDSCRLYDTVL